MNWQEAWSKREEIGCEDAVPLANKNTRDVTPREEAEAVLSCRKMWKIVRGSPRPPICTLVEGKTCLFK